MKSIKSYIVIFLFFSWLSVPASNYFKPWPETSLPYFNFPGSLTLIEATGVAVLSSLNSDLTISLYSVLSCVNLRLQFPDASLYNFHAIASSGQVVWKIFVGWIGEAFTLFKRLIDLPEAICFLQYVENSSVGYYVKL